jgi:pimeloyl-ACP methyl ester carboxylesterase
MQAETQYGCDEAAVPDALGAFLQALDRTLEEVRSRSPEYFEQHALRTTLPEPSAPKPSTIGEILGDAFDVEILFGAEPSSLSSVDRLLESRLGAARAGFPEAVTAESAEDVASFLASFLDSWTRRQGESRSAERSRLAGFPEPDTLRSARGGDLQYRVFGAAGPTLVVVNAIGMGLEYWPRFIDRLSPDHRIVLWPLRTTNPDGEVATLDDQVRDIGAVVDEVAEGPVHLMGWCSGPKLCLRYAATHPERVASMVFLAGTYGSPSTETGYQKRLGKVFELLDRSPGMAATVRGMLTDSASVAAGLSSQGGQAAGDFAQETEILARADPRLQTALIAPYRSDEATLAYAKQIRDFWNRPLDADVRAAGCPTLVVSAELDRIASPKLGQEVAKTLSRGRFVEMPGATHYCMYDRPDEVAALVRDFLASIEG